MTRNQSCGYLQTFEEADLAGDGIIGREEWHTLVINSPDIIGYMTLPVLSQARAFPSAFLMPCSSIRSRLSTYSIASMCHLRAPYC